MIAQTIEYNNVKFVYNVHDGLNASRWCKILQTEKPKDLY